MSPYTIDLRDFPKCEISIIAVTETNCTTDPIQCVRMDLGNSGRFEFFKPYTVFSDIPGGPITDRKPALGKQQLKACAYSDRNCTQDETCLEVEVDVLDCLRGNDTQPTAAPSRAEESNCTNSVTGFQLVDASTRPPLITDFVPPLIDLKGFPKCELSVIAKTESLPSGCERGTIRCVKMELGNYNRTEYFPPYTLYSDTGGNFTDRKPPIGFQTLKACAYTDRNCTQNAACLELEVDILDCVKAPAPFPVAVPSPIVPTIGGAPTVTNVNCTNNVTGFQLVDTSTTPATLSDFIPPYIDLKGFRKCELSVIALTQSSPSGCNQNEVRCVHMELGNTSRFEYFVPYTVYSDTPTGGIVDRKPHIGVQNLKACAYTDRNCTENAACLEYEVEVLDCFES